MLLLSTEIGKHIMIGDIKIEVKRVDLNGTVLIGIAAPADIPILRSDAVNRKPK